MLSGSVKKGHDFLLLVTIRGLALAKSEVQAELQDGPKIPD
jgi:hypothetical protein